MVQATDINQPADPTLSAEAAAPAANAPASEAKAHCANCDALLIGPFCYQCGQSLKTPIRELTGLAADLLEFITDVDGRFVKSLGLLYFRPGRLSMRYLDGQRVRFMRPLRMYLGLSILLFLAVSLTPGLELETDGDAIRIGDIEKPAAAEEFDPKKLQELLESAKSGGLNDPKQAEALSQQIQAQAAAAEAKAAADLREAQKSLPPKQREKPTLRIFGDEDWDKEDNPLVISWLPESSNVALNELIERAVDNMAKVEDEPQRLVDAFLDVMPQTMFVLLPLFALLLKLVYLFKKRLYVEHLIVALHSHSFLFLSFLLLWLLGELGEWLPGLESPATWLMIAIGSWIPVHLFLTQKRVYRQGWMMTTLKYGFVGTTYTLLISFGMLAALFISLLKM